ncbi:hypothetical protein [Micromonospora radicis]|nr:hypothetical protein [Micromonospora radicis]
MIDSVGLAAHRYAGLVAPALDRVCVAAMHAEERLVLLADLAALPG